MLLQVGISYILFLAKFFSMKKLFVSLVFLAAINASAQQSSFNADTVKVNLKNHISTLASDKYAGRETGTDGEKLAYTYIIRQFLSMKMAPVKGKTFLQEFPFTNGTEFGKRTFFSVNDKSYKLTNEFYPLAFSGNDSVAANFINIGYGIEAPKLDHDDYHKRDVKGKIVVIETTSPDGDNPHGKFGEFTDLKERAENAVKHGALAVIFINSKDSAQNPVFDFHNKHAAVAIPVIFAKGIVAKTLSDGTTGKVKLVVDLKKIEGKGHNVIGYIDNKSKHTVVIGAHYDHLGLGDEGSLYRGEAAIHNGADDNASGTAALIELARYFKKADAKNNNYMFIAFSGEEKGLLGSNYFIKNPTIDLSNVSYMLNMDMVGRLKIEDPVLIINGTGTAKQWNNAMKEISIDGLKTKTTESGVGPSDHTSFYLDSIPVLHFFSGTHPDYHKPSDDEPLINYDGEISIMRYMIQLIEKLDAQMGADNKLDFVKTNDSNNDNAPRFKVTLGVVPDYAFEGKGMRIDGVTDGKPASKAGLQKGDVVIKLGEVDVTDMMSYMKALGKFAKGDTTKVKYQRNNEEREAEVTF